MLGFCPPLLNTRPVVRYSVDTNTAVVSDDLAALGVTGDLVFDVVVDAGVEVAWFSGPGGLGMDFDGTSSTPLASTAILINKGRILGRGGAGGRSYSFTGNNQTSGGGGGGAGRGVGAEGASNPAATFTRGADGTSSAGGTGGATWGGASLQTNLTPGGGAPGIAGLNTATTRVFIVNDGEIWGGGGGGGGGGTSAAGVLQVGGDGGNPGQDGMDGVPQPGFGGGIGRQGGLGGAAGAAVDKSSTGWYTFIRGGSSPNVEGALL